MNKLKKIVNKISQNLIFKSLVNAVSNAVKFRTLLSLLLSITYKPYFKTNFKILNPNELKYIPKHLIFFYEELLPSVILFTLFNTVFTLIRVKLFPFIYKKLPLALKKRMPFKLNMLPFKLTLPFFIPKDFCLYDIPKCKRIEFIYTRKEYFECLSGFLDNKNHLSYIKFLIALLNYLIILGDIYFLYVKKK